MAFLPGATARAWLPYESSNAVARFELLNFEGERRLTSDVSLVSCVLMSDAHEAYPLMMAHLEVELPLPDQRLWAVGFRAGTVGDGESGLTPFITSGLVTACYPHGRGRNLPSSCVEVAMDTVGGMSGGPVYNSEGRVVGIVSTSFGGGEAPGPTY